MTYQKTIARGLFFALLGVLGDLCVNLLSSCRLLRPEYPQRQPGSADDTIR